LTRIASVETFIVELPRDQPYLGPLQPSERVNGRGYIVRKGNGTIYPTTDRSVVVRLTDVNGLTGWGETYGICAPRAVCEIINDLLAPELVGRDAEDVERVWDDLYGLMRVRGCFGGFHVDAIAALDIALWDLRARARGEPLWRLLGERRRERVPGYLSGLPAASLDERVASALDWHGRGHDAFKVATVVSHESVVAEIAALRNALGTDAVLMVDLHWRYEAEEAIRLAEALAPYGLHFIEAPVKPEDVEGLARVARSGAAPVAAGEEWHTSYEAKLRLDHAPVSFVQPEMGHTGVTQFMRIASLAASRGAMLAPHATIGTGLFLAASLHASVVVPELWRHEWQHSVFERNLALLDTDMGYADRHYSLSTGTGLGAVPNAAFWAHATAIS